jgi:hypothetical protein
MRTGWLLALAVLLQAPLGARAATPGDPVVASRTAGPIAVDGRLDEPDWDRARPFDAFVQLFPANGAPPTERTIVRVLYDDRALYVGVACDDDQPDLIVRSLGRRDSAPFSDYVMVVVDSMRDRRTGYVFGINAAGVQEDALFYDDDRLTMEWDAVWGGAVADRDGGWSAELAIPFSALRVSDAHEQVWGFAVKRLIGRSHEELATMNVRPGQQGTVSLLPPLVGLTELHPVQDLEITPYAAFRVVVAPEQEGVAEPRTTEPIGDLGFDLKASFGRALSLQATVNPDFGQVESDQILQNLSTYELFLPEKRPFFTQGMDLFQPVAPLGQPSPQQLFYSRRIGLDTPILGAAKVTGQGGDVQVGVLEAFVTGAPRPAVGEPAYAVSQPLHFAPAPAYPEQEPATRNFLAAVARWQESGGRTFGATFTSALPVGGECTQAELDSAEAAGVDPPPRCDVLVGNAGALHLDVRSADREWQLRGQVSGSQYLGGPPSTRLEDGTAIARGDWGWGAFLSAGRMGGEPWRFDVGWEYQSPTLQLNAAGYQRTQNEQALHATLRWVRPSGGGPFHKWEVSAGGDLRLTTDGRGLVRGATVRASAEAQLRSFQWLGCDANLDLAAWDVREIAQSGIAYGRPEAWGAGCWVSSDPAKALIVEASGGWGGSVSAGPFPAFGGWNAGGVATLRPDPRLEARLDVRYSDVTLPARWLELDLAAPGTYYFADLHAPALSVTLRGQVVITPRLSFQAYAQLFSTYYDYGAPYAATVAAGVDRIRPGDLSPAALPAGEPAPDSKDVAFNLNLILRWEYRLGSTIYVVYTRSQGEPDGATGSTLAPRGISTGPATDTVLVKWTYWWSR